MKRRLLVRCIAAFAAIPLALSSSVLAQESPDLTGIAALIVGGLATGEFTMAGGPAAVTNPEPAVYVVTPASGQAVTFDVAQPEPCLFTVSLRSADNPVTIHFDANKMRSLGVLLIDEEAGVFSYRITFSGTDGKLLIETPKETFPPPVDTWPMYSSVDLEGVQKAIGELRKACPGLTADG
jgi:hypothetical protein